MKNKEEIFKLLRESVETPQESFAVEEMISKIENELPPVITVSETKKIFNGYSFYKNKKGRFICTISLHRFLWMYLNGEISEGYDIHHKDFDKDNNSIDNLQILTKDEHNKIHLSHKLKKAPEKKTKFICKICGNEYEAVNRGNNNYCSQMCKKIAERTRATEIKICEICGKKFSTSDDARFCSPKCIGEYLKRQEAKTCPICGKTFSDVISKHRKYCSLECANTALRKREIRICIHCGKKFSALISRNQKFCSRECFYNHRKIQISPAAPVL